MDHQDDLKTKPTATAIMERLQSMEARLLGEISTLAGQVSTLATRKELMSLKEEVTTQFALLSSKIEVLNDDVLTVRAGQREILKRLTDSGDRVKV